MRSLHHLSQRKHQSHSKLKFKMRNTAPPLLCRLTSPNCPSSLPSQCAVNGKGARKDLCIKEPDQVSGAEFVLRSIVCILFRKIIRKRSMGQAFGSVMSSGRPAILVTLILFRPKPGQRSVGIWTQDRPERIVSRYGGQREGFQGGETAGWGS